MIERTIPNPYQNLYRTLIAAAFLMNVPAVILLMSGNQTITMFFGLAQFLMFFLGVIFLITGKKEVRGILRLLQGELIVHWTYDRFLWKRFADAELRRQQQNAASTLAAFLVAGPLLALTGYKGMTMNEGIVLGISLGIFAYGVGMIHARGVHKRSARPPFEAFIGPSSAFINGTYLDLTESNIRLTNIAVGNDPDTGHSSIVISYAKRGRHGMHHWELMVPIPDGKKDEAARVIARWSEWKK